MEKERVLLVVVDLKGKKSWPAAEIGAELEELVIACGGTVKDKIFCHLDKISASTFVGEGKVREIAALCCDGEFDMIVFSQDLKGSHQRNLEEVIGIKIIDRTQLILDIFAKHAKSEEGRMQVELAQLEYLLPRLVGKGISLSRLGGGIGTSGPGETKLEVDRRRVASRITKLKRELNELEHVHELTRKKRREKGIPAISLVGYTNAGKSTLMNKMTDSTQVVRDGLFTTLDSLSRQYILPNNQKTIISDTVGFMRDLPHHLIEAFKTTLKEVAEAELLLHVLDITKPNFLDLYNSVLTVLQDIGASEKPIITVFNKIDMLEDCSLVDQLLSSIKGSVAISAKTGENLDILSKEIQHKLSLMTLTISVNIPISRMDLVSLAHSEGQVYSVKYYNDHIFLNASLPSKIAGLFEKENIIVDEE